MQRTLLIVDDEINILSALKRVFKRDGYHVLQAASAGEALSVLEQHPIGVILTDYRMPGMSGTEFLHEVKERYPDTVRIILSGFSDIEVVTDAINRGAVYKFLTKPWEDDLLRANIEEAFERFEMRHENVRLSRELIEANKMLQQLNSELGQRVELRTQEVAQSRNMLKIMQQIVDVMPVGVVGVDEDGMVVMVNAVAYVVLQRVSEILPAVGDVAEDVLPHGLLGGEGEKTITLSGSAQPVCLRCWRVVLEGRGGMNGILLVFVQCDAPSRRA